MAKKVSAPVVAILLAILLASCAANKEHHCYVLKESWKSAIMEGKYTVADDIMEMYKKDGCP
jgi:uncharacterized lipoprotein YmbA